MAAKAWQDGGEWIRMSIEGMEKVMTSISSWSYKGMTSISAEVEKGIVSIKRRRRWSGEEDGVNGDMLQRSGEWHRKVETLFFFYYFRYFFLLTNFDLGFGFH